MGECIISNITMKSENNPNCAECINLESGGWCKALLRSVSGSRHIRKCSSFSFYRPNPKPVRKGCQQPSGLVQCTNCEGFIPWGLCDYGHSELSRLEPRIWRHCEDHRTIETTGCCNDCIHHSRSYCYLAEYPVTGKDKPISCQYFNQIKA